MDNIFLLTMKTIMVVDDEVDILDQIKSSLEEDDFQVVTADNNRRALEMLDEDKEDSFGLILIDTEVPGTGKSALFSMKPQSKKNIDTTNSEDFLQKPFTKEQLLDFVKNKI